MSSTNASRPLPGAPGDAENSSFDYVDEQTNQPAPNQALDKKPPQKFCSGAIIPFASGCQAVLSVGAECCPGTVSAIGFGNVANKLRVSCGCIDLSCMSPNMAFSVPRNGFVTSIAALFCNAAPLKLPCFSLKIVARLYSAPPGSNIFCPLPGACVVLNPPLCGSVPAGKVLCGLATNLCIPVCAGSRLMLVFSADKFCGPPVSEPEPAPAPAPAPASAAMPQSDGKWCGPDLPWYEYNCCPPVSPCPIITLCGTASAGVNII